MKELNRNSAAQLRREDEGWDTALVVNSEGILLGRLFKGQLEEPKAAAGDVMDLGPSTFRRDVDVMYGKFMKDNDLNRLRVTTSNGVAIGIVLREDLEKVMTEIHADPHAHELLADFRSRVLFSRLPRARKKCG